jgi:phosphoribosylanthranilate isomerase
VSPVIRPFVKVCGITRAEDALAAAAAGARAVGFVLVPGSPRGIADAEAAAIARLLPPAVARVGVTVNADPARVKDLAATVGLTAIQAHGDESPETCAAYGLPVVKALALPGGAGLDALRPFRGFPILLDGYDPRMRGGTGREADWELARRAGDAGYRILLAGGLGPENVARAVTAARPLAVDLNSGVESAPGLKDAARIRLAAERLGEFIPPAEDTCPW